MNFFEVFSACGKNSHTSLLVSSCFMLLAGRPCWWCSSASGDDLTWTLQLLSSTVQRLVVTLIKPIAFRGRFRFIGYLSSCPAPSLHIRCCWTKSNTPGSAQPVPRSSPELHWVLFILDAELGRFAGGKRFLRPRCQVNWLRKQNDVSSRTITAQSKLLLLLRPLQFLNLNNRTIVPNLLSIQRFCRLPLIAHPMRSCLQKLSKHIPRGIV